MAVPLAEFQSAWGFSVVPGYPGLANHTTHVPGNVKKRCETMLLDLGSVAVMRACSLGMRGTRPASVHAIMHATRQDRKQKALPSAATDDKAQD